MQKIKHGDHQLCFPDGERHFTGRDKRSRFVFDNYQYDRLEAAYHHVTSYDTAVDVGAHVGLLTLHLAERFRVVYAIEPDKDNFACLQVNTRHLPNVVPIRAALGDKSGRVSLDRGRGDNSGDVCVTEGKDVELRRLDDFQLTDLGLLKVDVQGYEHLVLRGAKDLLQAFGPACVVECEPPEKLRRSYAKKGVDEVAAFFKQEHWDYRLVNTVGKDRVYAPGPNGVKPYTKYAIRGDYHWQQHNPGKAMGRCIEDVTAYVNSQNHGGVLDVGCGDGHCTARLKNALGVDDNATALALARRHGVPCLQLSVYRIHHLGHHFGAVTLFDVFEHLPRQELALDAIAGVTDTLYILNPDPVGTHWHTREFTEDQLTELVTGRGWAVEHRRRYDMSGDNKKTLLHLTRVRS